MSLRAISVIGNQTSRAFDTMSLNFGSLNTNKYLSVASNSSFNFGSAMSFSAWVNPTATLNGSFLNKYFTTGNQRSFRVDCNNDGALTFGLQINLSGDGGNAVSFKNYLVTGISAAAWHHIGFTFASSTLKIYVDGAEVTPTKLTDTTVSSIFNSTADVYVGATDLAGTPANFLSSYVDEMALFSVGLTAAEMAAIYNSGTPISLTLSAQYANLVSWWRFGEGSDSASTVFDVKGTNNLTGTNLVSGDFSSSVP